MKNKMDSPSPITKRVKIGEAWYKKGNKVKKFPSGFITPEGVRLLNLIVSQTQERVNIYLLPNPKRRSTPEQPALFIFVPYWVLPKNMKS